MPINYQVGSSAYVRPGPSIDEAVAAVKPKGYGDERGASEIRTVEVVGDAVRIRCDYSPQLVVVMRALGISRRWRQSEKAYVVPLDEFNGLVEETLSRLEFEVL